MNRELISEAIFGSFDGIVCVLGTITALLMIHSSNKTILVAALGFTVAETVSMSGAEFLSDNKTRWIKVLVMGMSVLLGCLVPLAPFFVWTGDRALGISLALTFLLALVIAELRRKRRIVSYFQTFIVLALALGMSIEVSRLLG